MMPTETKDLWQDNDNWFIINKRIRTLVKVIVSTLDDNETESSVK